MAPGAHVSKFLQTCHLASTSDQVHVKSGVGLNCRWGHGPHAYTLRKDDDDFGQPGTLVREVLDDDARTWLVSNVVGHLKAGVCEPVLKRAFEYWRNIDKDIGDRIAKGVAGK